MPKKTPNETMMARRAQLSGVNIGPLDQLIKKLEAAAEKKKSRRK
tara:strand:+ start:526 stop:660 length:135 start_codon:yes stop_codon:yes gene_type:complete